MKILITDDHSVVRQGYASVLPTVIDPCEIIEASSGEQAAELYQSEKPDIVIMDINLPGISGIEAATRILESDRDAKIMFFSMYDESLVVKQALDAGAMGYITKSGSPKTLLEAVTRISKGEIFIEYDLVMKLALNNQNVTEGLLRELTQREFEVFVMLARGQSSQIIADTLELNIKTVSNYITTIKSKLQISSTAEIVHLAVEAGVVKIGS
ncbi:response regulator transcription factor [Neptuniibacter caesariensis]|uniref:DNA-binding response regulator, LuxR family protein n=1 Tax=Neptuniibacter caesariensis TaxID=207954 RepID=A0A7U8C8M0_NEPCE|nr:response regulator transcription factor [Neptuniibacter caesariensis]EAR62105.1 DNA-binding response regulator, LuxR family protein [Oceanospirillum sp. MED92] [Neptuniibacter caesariensis]